MVKGDSAILGRWSRYVASRVPGLLLLAGIVAITMLASMRIENGVGVFVSIVAGACLGLGALLVYWNSVDWLNLRVIRRQPALRDGKVVAFSGVVRIDVEPLISPLGGTPCAAYDYALAETLHASRGTGANSTNTARQRAFAQGFHMLRSRIEGVDQSLGLRSFPSFEDDLRKEMRGEEWVPAAQKLLESIADTAQSGIEGAAQARLLQLRHGEIEEVHEDHRGPGGTGSADHWTMDEGVLPVGEVVCVVGTYDWRLRGLTARRSRLGPNLMVYRGSVEDVLSRVGKEVSGYSRVAAVLVGIAVLWFGLVFAPAAWTSSLPIIGSVIIQRS